MPVADPERPLRRGGVGGVSVWLAAKEFQLAATLTADPELVLRRLRCWRRCGASAHRGVRIRESRSRGLNAALTVPALRGTRPPPVARPMSDSFGMALNHRLRRPRSSPLAPRGSTPLGDSVMTAGSSLVRDFYRRTTRAAKRYPGKANRAPPRGFRSPAEQVRARVEPDRAADREHSPARFRSYAEISVPTSASS